MAQHPALTSGRVAVITGAASGIGRGAAERFADMGLRLCLADVAADALDATAAAIAARTANGAADVLALLTDVRDAQALAQLKNAAYDRFGAVDVLLANAGVEPVSRVLEPGDAWTNTIAVNLWGVIHTIQAFVPAMIAAKAADGTPGAIIATGSKQGITCPPGNTAYNISKAGVKVFTEALAHELRQHEGCAITAHLLVPGFTFTGFTRAHTAVKPDAAWLPDQVIAFMIERMAAGDFYIICPDNEVTRKVDNARMTWAMQDVTENRPPLSRWHPDFAAAFKDFMAS